MSKYAVISRFILSINICILPIFSIWANTHYLVAIALIEAELKREAKNLAKERREAELKKSEKGQ